MNGVNRNQYEYEEIDLKDYVRVLAKRKLLIFLFAVTGMLAAGFLSFAMPRLYTAKPLEVIIEVGTKGGGIMKSPPQIIGEFEQNFFTVPLAEKLNIPLSRFPKIKASSPPDTNLVKFEIRSSDEEKARKILEGLAQIILQEQEERVNIRIASLEDQIKLLEQNVEILQKDRTQSSNIVLLLSRISDLKRELDTIAYPAIRKAPSALQEPVSQFRFAFNIILGAILGLFFGTFFAFATDWWKKSSSVKTP